MAQKVIHSLQIIMIHSELNETHPLSLNGFNCQGVYHYCTFSKYFVCLLTKSSGFFIYNFTGWELWNLVELNCSWMIIFLFTSNKVICPLSLQHIIVIVFISVCINICFRYLYLYIFICMYLNFYLFISILAKLYLITSLGLWKYFFNHAFSIFVAMSSVHYFHRLYFYLFVYILISEYFYISISRVLFLGYMLSWKQI